MNDNVTILPVWKKNMTTAEFLRDLALMADKEPDKWQKLVVIRVCDEEKIFSCLQYYHNIDTLGAIGVMTYANHDLCESSVRQRL